MTSPYGLAWGPDGNLYVAATDKFALEGVTGFYGRIMYFSPDGEYLGDYVEHADYFALTDSGPRDIDFGPDGNLYVTNQTDSKILIFSGPDGLQPGQHIGTLTAPDWVTFTGANSIEFVVDK